MKKALILLFSSCLIFCTYAKGQSDSLEFEIHGFISYKNGTTVKMKVKNTVEKPALKSEGELLKSFENEIFGAKVTGWLSIGRMRVTAITKEEISFLLLKELSVITENGVKKDHFKIGQEVKFKWKQAVEADVMLYEKGMDTLEIDMKAALECFYSSVKLNPVNHKSLNMIGIVYNKLNISDSAHKYFNEAYKLDTTNLTYIKNLVLGEFSRGNLNRSKILADKAVQYGPKDAEAYYMRGIITYYQNKDAFSEEVKTGVLSDLSLAISFEPKNPFYHKERMVIRGIFGDINGACEDAQSYKQLQGKDADNYMTKYCK